MQEDLLHIFYNDQPPNGAAKDSDGHSKGIILANENGGIWILHSVPHFPLLEKNYGYPSAGLRNGQVFFCLSLNKSQIDGIGNILMYTRPNIYNFSLPNTMKKIFPTLAKVVNKERVRNPPWNYFTNLNVGNVDGSVLSLSAFTKGPKFQRGKKHIA